MMKAEKEIAGIFKKAKLLELNVDFASVCPKYEKKLLKKNTLCPYRVPSREAVNPLVLDETFKKNGPSRWFVGSPCKSSLTMSGSNSDA